MKADRQVNKKMTDRGREGKGVVGTGRGSADSWAGRQTHQV